LYWFNSGLLVIEKVSKKLENFQNLQIPSRYLANESLESCHFITPFKISILSWFC